MEYIHVKNFKSEFIRKEEENKLLLQPAVKDFEGNLHPSPYLDKYVQINYITQKPVLWGSSNQYDGKMIESEIVVFDRYYYQKRKEIVSYIDHRDGNIKYIDKRRFDKSINLINKYIDLGRDIKKIRFDKFSQFSQDIDEPVRNLIRIVSGLKFKYYESGSVRAKKDDWLWVEVEIRNLPIYDKYIIKLIHNSVSKIAYSHTIEDYGILMILDDEGTENNKFPYERKLCKKEFNIGEKILAELINDYEMIEHSFELLTSEEQIWI